MIGKEDFIPLILAYQVKMAEKGSNTGEWLLKKINLKTKKGPDKKSGPKKMLCKQTTEFSDTQ
jgi:hypothetical protein